MSLLRTIRKMKKISLSHSWGKHNGNTVKSLLPFLFFIVLAFYLAPLIVEGASAGEEVWILGEGGDLWAGNCTDFYTTTQAATNYKILQWTVDDCVSHWSFDEGTGDTAHDENITNSNTGTRSGFTDGWVSGRYGDYALDFDGTDDYVDCGNDASLNITDAITIAAWVNTNDTSSEQKIVNKRDTWNSLDGYSMYITSQNLYFEYGNGVNYRQLSRSMSYAAGEWMHVAITLEGSTVTFYKNGSALGTQAGISGIATNAYHLAIGSKHFVSLPFHGSIDEVRIYNRALTNDEINQTRDNEHHSPGNITTNHTFSSGLRGSKVKIEGDFATANYTVDFYASADGSSWNLEQANITSGTNYSITSGYKAKNQYARIELNSTYVTETPEVYNLTMYSEANTAPEMEEVITIT